VSERSCAYKQLDANLATILPTAIAAETPARTEMPVLPQPVSAPSAKLAKEMPKRELLSSPTMNKLKADPKLGLLMDWVAKHATNMQEVGFDFVLSKALAPSDRLHPT
jgi:hypothetical protein